MYFAKEVLESSSKMRLRWEDEVKKLVSKWADQKPEAQWSTVSDLPIKRLYTPDDIKDMEFDRDISYPGQYPYIRGNQATGYRGKYWTFRMFSGMGDAATTNERWHMLLKEGQTGLSTAFDFPTLMGYDTDSPKARGECGKCGVAIDTLEDFLQLMDGIPLDKVTTSMTINPPATALWAMYCATARIAGHPPDKDRRDDPERYAQGVYRPEDLHVSARTVRQADQRHGGIRHAIRPPVEHDQHQWLPYPGSGRHGGSGTGLYASRRHRIRRRRHPPQRTKRGLFCTATFLLLQRPCRFLRGDLQDAGGPADLGQDHAGSFQVDRRAVLVDAFPHPDGRLLADGPAALQQCRPHGPSGACLPSSAGPSPSIPTPWTRSCACRPITPFRSPCEPSRLLPRKRA